MKHTKIIIAAILALTLTACGNTEPETEVGSTNFSYNTETTSEAATSAEVTTTTETQSQTTAAATSAQTTEKTKSWSESEISATLYLKVSCYSRSEPIVGTESLKKYEAGQQINVVAITDTGYYKLDDGTFIHSDYTTDTNPAADGENLTFSISKVTVRLYDSDMYSDGMGNCSEPSSEDKKLLEKAANSLTVYKRYNEFIDYKNYNEAANAGKGEPPLIMDNYLDKNGNAAAKLRWVFESDFNGDGHNESLLAISTAYIFTEVGAQNEFLVYINDKGEAVPVAQACNFRIYEALDYGDFKYIPIIVGDNNVTAGTYIFDFDGTGFTEKVYAEYAYPVYDEATGRIYFTIQGYPDCCYTLNSKTLDYDKCDVSREEFDEFYKNYKYED